MIFHVVKDFVRGAVRKSAVFGYLGLKVPKKITRRAKIWMSEEQRLYMFRSIAVESEQLLDVVRKLLSHEEQYYVLR